jgi:hypothetical protein
MDFTVALDSTKKSANLGRLGLFYLLYSIEWTDRHETEKRGREEKVF